MFRLFDRMQDAAFVAALPKTRADAKAMGSTMYYTGIPCARGHDMYRKTANGNCAKCASDHTHKRIKALPREVIGAYRIKSDKRWNESMKGKTAKQRWRVKDPRWAWVVSALGGARTRTKGKDVPFNLTNEYLFDRLPTHCPVLGVEFVWIGAGTNWASPSIDRIKPELGYVEGNVAVISRRANMIKSDATLEEVSKVLEWMKGYY